MRRLLLAVALLLCPALASAQVALVQSQTSTTGTMWTTGSFDETLTFAGAVTSGNTVVAWTSYGNSARTMSCTHDGNAMTAVLNKGATATNGDMAMLVFARVATTTGTGVTCTISGNDANGIQGFSTAEFSGMAAALSTSGGAGVSATTSAETAAATSHDSGADLTPDTTHNLMLGGVVVTADGGTWGNDGFTMLISGTLIRHGYLIQSAATAGDWVPTTSNARSGEVGLVNLDGAAGGGGGGTTCTRMLLGVGACE